jgi:hypothetical protein
MQSFTKPQTEKDNNDGAINDDEEEEEGEENFSEEEIEAEDLLDVNGNKVYSAVQVEDLLSRCLAAISNRGSITSRYVSYSSNLFFLSPIYIVDYVIGYCLPHFCPAAYFILMLFPFPINCNYQICFEW